MSEKQLIQDPRIQLDLNEKAWATLQTNPIFKEMLIELKLAIDRGQSELKKQELTDSQLRQAQGALLAFETAFNLPRTVYEKRNGRFFGQLTKQEQEAAANAATLQADRQTNLDGRRSPL